MAGEGQKPLGGRDSYSKRGCNSADVCYSSQDIYFLEVCILNSICDNGAQLFELQVGQIFHCELSESRLEQVKHWILAAS